ncbi:MAG TPA: plastocyanin/azurin family copper-binding protein [Ktedonobacteraceae bacterium]
MNQGKHRGWTNCRLFGSCAALALGLVLFSACGGSGHNTTSSTGSANSGNAMGANGNIANASGENTGTTPVSSGNNNTNGTPSGQTSSSGACDQRTKVTISDKAQPGKANEYTFTPDHVTIKAGQFIFFSNQSNQVHTLVASPDASLADSTIDRNEEQPVQFTKAGTYTLESQDPKHRGTMQVTVNSAAGATCGISAPSTTVTFTEKVAQGRPDAYALTPKTVSISAGQTIALLNKTDQSFNFSCKPSADIAEGNLRVDMNEQQVVQFAKAGKYTCTSTESPAEAVAVTVH